MFFFLITDNQIKKMLDIINKESEISLRILDWFVTNFSKKNNIIYDMKSKNGMIEKYNVYLDYKAQLKAYSKKYAISKLTEHSGTQFDPRVVKAFLKILKKQLRIG